MPAEPGLPPLVRGAVRVGRAGASIIARRAFDLHVEGRERLPSGPFVLAGNHYSHLDPPIGYVAVGRPIRYLAVDEIYGLSNAFDRLLLFFGTIPMSRRRAPLGALRVALEHLDAGGIVGLFPEGKRVTTWGDEEPRRGAAWLSLGSGAPVVPIAVSGTDEAFGVEASRISRAPVRVRFGTAIRPESFIDHVDPIGAMTGEWRGQIESLIDVRYALADS
ncbi:MAG: 1-acyl-sn-glycerol-3-phosphate acyltransferase [Acidimicrobiia bacterium]|nr:1-acyl-sn-glycerol-3-phosphate acyltransferase [Acidimicrobiia bacterium]NNF63113.1 1-acyl-sn-glycerol-3-phosphate acyltransferase [Acidimicrobiia bacterium]